MNFIGLNDDTEQTRMIQMMILCKFTVNVTRDGLYTNEQLLESIRQPNHLHCYYKLT